MAHRRTSTLLFLMSASAALTVALASSPGFGEELGLEQAAARAVAHSPAVAASADAKRAATARVSQARSAWLPRLRILGSYHFIQPVPELSVDTGITPPGQSKSLSFTNDVGTAQAASITAQLAWRALDFGARSSRVDAASLDSQAAQDDQASRAVDIAWAARRAYLTASFFDATAQVTDASLATARAALQRAHNARKAGLANDVDVARAQTRVAELQRRKTEALQRKAQAIDSLRVLLGLDDDAPVTLRDSLQDSTMSLAVADRTQTPEIEALEARRKAVAARVDMVRSGWFPTVDLVVQGSYGYPRTFIETVAGFSGSAGVQLTWDVFDGGRRSAQIDELQARAAQLADARRAKADEAHSRRREARAGLRIARSSLAAATAQLDAAQIYLRSAHASRQAGLATRLDVRQAEQAVDQARLAQVRARLDAALAHADLLRAEGISVRSNQPAKEESP